MNFDSGGGFEAKVAEKKREAMKAPHEAPARGAQFQVKHNTNRSKPLLVHSTKRLNFDSGAGFETKVGKVKNRSPGARGNPSSPPISSISFVLTCLC